MSASLAWQSQKCAFVPPLVWFHLLLKSFINGCGPRVGTSWPIGCRRGGFTIAICLLVSVLSIALMKEQSTTAPKSRTGEDWRG